MKTYQLILLIILGLIGVLLLVAFFMGKAYRVQRSIMIKASPADVYDFVRQLKNQDRFNKWVMVEPQMQKMYTGNDGEIGFIYGWNGSSKAGEGEQELVSLVANQQVISHIRFKRPIEGLAISTMDIVSTTNQEVTVTWTNDSEMKYPLNLLLPMVEKLLAKDMDESLGNLKRILEEGK
jgi:hypothetical protein